MTKSTSSPASKLSELRIKHITQLSKLLFLPPGLHPSNPLWLQSQAKSISKLSETLLRSSALLLRFAMRLPCSLQQATLCKTHKPLNPFLIHSVFLAIGAETTTRLIHLVSNPILPLPAHIYMFIRRLQSLSSLWMSPGAYRVAFQVQPFEARYERVENDCEACILARIGGDEQMLCDLRATIIGRRKKGKLEPGLRKLVEAWIEELDVGKARKEQIYDVSEKLGKDIRGLRRQMQLLRRQKKIEIREGKEFIVNSPISQPQPRAQEAECLSFIPKQNQSSWNSIDSTLVPLPSPVSPRPSSIHKPLNSDLETDHVTSSKNQRSHSEDYEDEDQYFEDSLINFYAALSSSGVTDRSSIHPAFARKDSEAYVHACPSSTTAYRDSVIFDAASGPFARRSQHTQNQAQVQDQERSHNPFADPIDEDLVPAPLAPTRAAYQSAYTASSYSQDGDTFASQQTSSRAQFSGLLRRNAEEQAREYRALVEVDEEDEFVPSPPRGRTTAAERGMENEDYRWEEDARVPFGSARTLKHASQSTHWTDFYD